MSRPPVACLLSMMVASKSPDPGPPLFERVGGRAKLAVLVRNFYSTLRIHPVLGPIFAAHVGDWPAHFARLTEFWAAQTGAPPPSYRGKLLHAHAPLELRAEHFEGWLAQWRGSCRLHYDDPEAGELIALAERLALRMRPVVAVTRKSAAGR